VNKIFGEQEIIKLEYC